MSERRNRKRMTLTRDNAHPHSSNDPVIDWLLDTDPSVGGNQGPREGDEIAASPRLMAPAAIAKLSRQGPTFLLGAFSMVDSAISARTQHSVRGKTPGP